MSADNLITILSTKTANGGREWRVAEHADSGNPISHFCQTEDGPWKARCSDAAHLVDIFAKSEVFASADSAFAKARQEEEEAGFVEYGISSADLDESWDELQAQAAVLRERRKSCRWFQPVPEDGMWVNDPDSIDWWAPNYVEEQLAKLGWTSAEARAVRWHLWDTYSSGEHGQYRFPDRLRLARCGNPAEEAAFASMKARGCCSCYEHRLEVALEGEAKSVILIGFNYGH